MTCSECETFNLYTHEPELMSSSLQEHPTKTEGSVDCSVKSFNTFVFYIRMCVCVFPTEISARCFGVGGF